MKLQKLRLASAIASWTLNKSWPDKPLLPTTSPKDGNRFKGWLCAGLYSHGHRSWLLSFTEARPQRILDLVLNQTRVPTRTKTVCTASIYARVGAHGHDPHSTCDLGNALGNVRLANDAEHVSFSVVAYQPTAKLNSRVQLAAKVLQTCAVMHHHQRRCMHHHLRCCFGEVVEAGSLRSSLLKCAA